MLPAFRLATLHPALVHFTIGGLPLIVIAYAIAWRRRSPDWAFVGDAALVVTAALTVFAGVSGLVSNVVVPWPGGLEFWRLVHLIGGLLTTASLGALAAWRLWRRMPRRRARPLISAQLVLMATATAGLALGTGFVGGEVLVFHAGMAVRAAGQGALSPPIFAPAPKTFPGAMGQARAAWGGVESRLAFMLVQHPSDEDFVAVAADARRLQAAAGIMADEGAKDPHHADLLTSMSQTLAGDAADIADAAAAKNLQDLARAVGEASADCADCHEQARWKNKL